MALELGHEFANPALLTEALTHASWTHEHGGKHNERLEYLGDSVFNASTTILLFERFPEASEGELTRMRSRLVDTQNLALLGRQLELGSLLKLGRGEEQSGGRERDSLLENAMEAVIGAVFLDAGFEVARNVVARLLAQDLAQIRQLGRQRRRGMVSPRAALQELTQKHWKLTPVATAHKESGPSHAPVFVAEVRVGDRVMGTGSGSTKKEAKKAACALALSRVKREVDP